MYISDSDYGYYQTNGTKVSQPFGMAVQKVTGDNGSVEVKISKQLMNSVPAIRYTISTFDPGVSNSDSLWQGGSSAVDVYPGTNATFGGEINGYGEISSMGLLSVSDYTIYYVYDGINPVVEYSPEGSILARYIYANGLHIAKIAGADTHFYHCDALGSARVMTDENAAIQWQARYWPFGEMTRSGVADNTHGFTGKEWDTEMGLNYFCQRYYDPEIGRFITLDPFFGYVGSPQSQNRYAYCVNNPLKYVDPQGLDAAWTYYDDIWFCVISDFEQDHCTEAMTPFQDFSDLRSSTQALKNYDAARFGGNGQRTIAGAGRGGHGGRHTGGAHDGHLSHNFDTPELPTYSYEFSETMFYINYIEPLDDLYYSFTSRPFTYRTRNISTGELYEGSSNAIVGVSIDYYLPVYGSQLEAPSMELGVGWGKFLGVGFAWDKNSVSLAVHLGASLPPSIIYTSSVWWEIH